MAVEIRTVCGAHVCVFIQTVPLNRFLRVIICAAGPLFFALRHSRILSGAILIEPTALLQRAVISCAVAQVLLGGTLLLFVVIWFRLSWHTFGVTRSLWNPKGADLSAVSQAQLDIVARKLNTRPRETLHWKTPAHMLSNSVSMTH